MPLSRAPTRSRGASGAVREVARIAGYGREPRAIVRTRRLVSARDAGNLAAEVKVAAKTTKTNAAKTPAAAPAAEAADKAGATGKSGTTAKAGGNKATGAKKA